MWVSQALRLMARRPAGLFLMLLAFMFLTTAVAALLGLVGAVLQLMVLPLLSLGFMLATHAVMQEQPVHPGLFVQPLRRASPQQRKVLIQLCILYGLAAFAVMALLSTMVGDTMRQAQEIMAKPGPDAPRQVAELLEQQPVGGALALTAVLITALSVPFWYAPALAYWGRQGLAQSLFSSTLAVWRSKGAMLVALLCWGALSVLITALSLFLASALKLPALIPSALMLGGTVVGVGFYVAQLYAFNDSFGSQQAIPDPAPDAGSKPPPTPPAPPSPPPA